MANAHCPSCDMLLAPDVQRCRYCGCHLPTEFWDAARAGVAIKIEAQPTENSKKQEPPKQEPVELTIDASISMTSKLAATTGGQVESGFTPPSIGWPMKVSILLVVVAAIFLLWPTASEGEKQATDCRSQCIEKEKQLSQPPRHFMSGCMQTCMRP